MAAICESSTESFPTKLGELKLNLPSAEEWSETGKNEDKNEHFDVESELG